MRITNISWTTPNKKTQLLNLNKKDLLISISYNNHKKIIIFIFFIVLIQR